MKCFILFYTLFNCYSLFGMDGPNILGDLNLSVIEENNENPSEEISTIDRWFEDEQLKENFQGYFSGENLKSNFWNNNIQEVENFLKGKYINFQRKSRQNKTISFFKFITSDMTQDHFNYLSFEENIELILGMLDRGYVFGLADDNFLVANEKETIKEIFDIKNINEITKNYLIGVKAYLEELSKKPDLLNQRVNLSYFKNRQGILVETEVSEKIKRHRKALYHFLRKG